MTHIITEPRSAMHQPDPELDRQFYDGVPSRRLIAWFLDAVVIFAIFAVTALVFGIMTLGFGFFVAPLIFVATGFFYRVILISSASATFGMMLTGIEFRDAQGQRFSFGTAFLHTLAYSMIFTSGIFQVASCLAILMTDKGQSIPDLLLGTVAINKPL